MMAAFEQAQAAAIQPGDENLDCDQLQEQMVAAVNDPAVRAQIESAGAAAEKDLAALEAAQGEMAGRAAATIIVSLVPGAAMATMAADAAGAAAKQAQAAERVQSHLHQAQQLTTIMPTILRGQRLIELAAARGCEWAAGANLDAGFVPVGAPAKAGSDR